MSTVIDILAEAKKEIKLADHLFYVTYPTIQSTKFLFAITEHIIKSVKIALEVLLEREREARHIDPFPRDFRVELETFRYQVMRRHNFDASFFHFLKTLENISKCSKASLVRFERDNKYYLTTSEYETASVDYENVKKYLKFGKQFICKIDECLKPKEATVHE